MYKNYKILGLIPARGNSKGVPRKNLRPLGNKPLIAWTIEEGKKSKYLDELVVSSEDAEIIRVAQEFGCKAPFVRPSELSQDTTPGINPALHALEKLPGFDFLVLLQPTSPLRLSDDIDAAIELCIESKAPSCVSMTTVSEQPFWMYSQDPASKILAPILPKTSATRRQDFPITYRLNGAIYVANTQSLLQSKNFIFPETVGFWMPPERSVDLDTEQDLRFLNFLVQQYP